MLESTLLWIDAALNLLLGVGLLTFPPAIVHALGLPETKATIYPRIFGGVLIGIAIAIVVEATVPALGGLGLGGAIAINLSGAVVVSGCLISHMGDITATGRTVLWTVVVVLTVLSAVEFWVV
jgi:hypothetical protein